MIRFRRRCFLFLLLCRCGATALSAATYFVAPTGDDTAAGTEAAPFATLMRAQAAAGDGDTVLLRGGAYRLDASHIAHTDELYASVNVFTKSGVSYLAYPGETPVFDFSAVRPVARRVTAFYVRANRLRFRGFHVVGVQVTIRDGEARNTQSESFRIRHGSGNTLERLVLRDGMGIGVYILGDSADNLVLNCDAYNNVGLDRLSIGNVDGFGAHTTAAGTGNVFRGCRAWLNSDDGFDLINCRAPVVIERCQAFFNGYLDAALARGGDGTGFKAGGYGRDGSALPSPVPRHVVRFSLAVGNRANGFYANHHPGGLDFVHNTPPQRREFQLPQRARRQPHRRARPRPPDKKQPRLFPARRVRGAARRGRLRREPQLFNLPVTVTAEDFVAAPTDTARLLAYVSAPREPDGELPAIDLLRLAADSDLIDRGVVLDFPYNGAAPDLGYVESDVGTLGSNVGLGVSPSSGAGGASPSH